MIEIKHEKLNIKGKYRCIVISDIHSHLERFQQILKEVDYTTNDYLIINGDFVEKGTQAIENGSLSSISPTTKQKSICFTW